MYSLMLCLIFLPAAVRASALCPDARSSSFVNANHIFNAIHSSMRQWGSSIHHNGMSFFLASVPRGTLLYHGTLESEPVNGTEYLAFEPEHARMFADVSPMPHPPPPPSPMDRPDRYKQEKLQADEHRQKPLSYAASVHRREESWLMGGQYEQQQHSKPPENGWLHTYEAAKDLRLLYVDGMSAGKTVNGTLDSQDRILLSREPHSSDYDRAYAFCRMAREDWLDRIDGIIRMESGFEIILCSFERDLHLYHMAPVKPREQNGHASRGGKFMKFQTLKAVASRYHGIGGNRVTLNYENFVTMYDARYGIDLFNRSDVGEDNGNLDRNPNKDECGSDWKHPRRPRLTNVPDEQLRLVRQDVRELIMKHNAHNENNFDWQAVTDLVVQRYADPLKYLVSSAFSSADQLREEIFRILEPFAVDLPAAKSSNVTVDIKKCASQFLPPSRHLQESLAGRTIYSVTSNICSTLGDALQESGNTGIVEYIEKLINYLSWSEWKDCRGCAYSEMCSVPMWPWGIADDYENPKCRSAHNIDGLNELRYWGGWMF